MSCCLDVGRLKAYCLVKLGRLTARRDEPGMLEEVGCSALWRIRPACRLFCNVVGQGSRKLNVCW